MLEQFEKHKMEDPNFIFSGDRQTQEMSSKKMCKP